MAYTSDKNPVRILVVDDDEFLRCTLKDILRWEGYSVETATDGMSAFDKLRVKAFDIVITDLYMPGMDGLQLLDKIYAEKMDVIPILMSSLFSGKAKSHAFKKGVYANLDKPFRSSVLFSVIENSVKERYAKVGQV